MPADVITNTSYQLIEASKTVYNLCDVSWYVKL